jgi:hypothetical protein
MPWPLLTLRMYTPYPANASALLHDRQWRKAIMVRDPLDRLLSGVLDKCVRRLFTQADGTVADHCPGAARFMEVTPEGTRARPPLAALVRLGDSPPIQQALAP